MTDAEGFTAPELLREKLEDMIADAHGLPRDVPPSDWTLNMSTVHILEEEARARVQAGGQEAITQMHREAQATLCAGGNDAQMQIMIALALIIHKGTHGFSEPADYGYMRLHPVRHATWARGGTTLRTDEALGLELRNILDCYVAVNGNILRSRAQEYLADFNERERARRAA